MSKPYARLVDPGSAREMTAADRAYRRFRPWLWTWLGGRRFWQLTFEPYSAGVWRLSGARLKTRADRDLDRRMDRCCCHPGQPRGHA